ncbi:C2 calcium-dependent membrane targeting [Macleaya cordata]|uniref:C2 calcium-dependent membrane targeting n=1 Tax=Macleaya cordata TaxID=56857 RepID=A0A200Q633_MACCD|nr:C2 calcium-dependent membrane targeting [Macleaya cordata]
MEQPTEQIMTMSGLLEVMLVDARGLPESDSFGKMDPYVLIQYKDQKLKSTVAKGQGSNPVWNERFTLWVQCPEADDQYNLILKIMDKDTFSSDDFLGEIAISVKDVVELGMEIGKVEKQPCKYKVINLGSNNMASAGEIQVGFTFTRKE